jgi:hypothetical protein
MGVALDRASRFLSAVLLLSLVTLTVVFTTQAAFAACGMPSSTRTKTATTGTPSRRLLFADLYLRDPLLSVRSRYRGMCFEALEASARRCVLAVGFLRLRVNYTQLIVRDDSGQNSDLLNWRLLSPHEPDMGAAPAARDPTVDTAYAFCIYDAAQTPRGAEYIANVRYRERVRARRRWRKVGSHYKYFATTRRGARKGTDSTFSARDHARRSRRATWTGERLRVLRQSPTTDCSARPDIAPLREQHVRGRTFTRRLQPPNRFQAAHSLPRRLSDGTIVQRRR